MKRVVGFWLLIFAISAISIGFTHDYLICPLWVVNALAGYYLVRIRKKIGHPIAIFLFAFSNVFIASILFDLTKDIATKATLSVICALQIQCFISVYYLIALQIKQFKYKNTLLLTVPNTIASCLGSLMFMLWFEVGENYYEFVDYFLEQMTTGIAVICMLMGVSVWKKIRWQDYFYLISISVIQYFISMDRIFYACLILPCLMYFYALNYCMREFMWLIGLLVFTCLIYVSLPLAGEYWSESEVHMLSRISTYRLTLGLYLIIFLFICEIYLVNRRLYRDLERITFTDELTTLNTRRYIKRVIQQKPLLHGGSILLDIDNFKRVNDQYGHYIGDLVLQHMSKILKDACPNDAVISRWGGEEFLVILSDYDENACKGICDKILNLCQHRAFKYEDIELNMTFSMGVTTFNQLNLSNYEQILQQVDQCLYQAKGEGKNRFVYA